MCLGILDHISQDILEFDDALSRLTEARESKRGDMGDGSEAGGDDVTRQIRSLYFCLIKESVAHYVGCVCLICV
jgi:hypothetical protein